MLFGHFRGNWGQLCAQGLSAVELVTLWGQALQACQVQAWFGQLLPFQFGGLQRGAGFGVLGL
ncbi:hypothetical protein D3C75_1369870 [compost metagenome]